MTDDLSHTDKQRGKRIFYCQTSLKKMRFTVASNSLSCFYTVGYRFNQSEQRTKQCIQLELDGERGHCYADGI